ncbi:MULTISPECIES: HAMP domain-containing sensor histidine kinase [Paenibacillus]|uniref:HAMP domain-containing sensor histidine kinase n=1 Tax=Paenibacillus TaxID=44249 RepID=UPI002DB5D1DF|nr:HAMP domain-containing sensor histidine kinase [Paenibacillus odorifer]MEC0134197.1 HAMP domain-containing sensor histidine kinase [Paenibacillus odorifer]MEC0222518.1 HAMP domain-containing sensor histidine kinase [Paenibacillus odorifer]
MSKISNKLSNRISLPIYFSLIIFFIFLITVVITGLLFFLAQVFGLLNEELAQDGFVLPIMVLIACTIIGTTISAITSRKMVKSIRLFIEATERLASGDFSMRLQLKSPPEFEILSENFNRMAEELGGIEILRTDFVNNFSHEFKTPIVSIKGFAEVLKNDDLTKEERNEYLDIVIEESTRLASLASNVLELTQVETQKILTNKMRFNVGEQIRQSVLLLAAKFEKKHLKLNVNIQDYELSGNKELLNQVWLNLLDNAIKFTPEHGEIEVTMKKNEDNLVILVRDCGSGIHPEALPKIFDKFYQQDTSHSTAGNGLGLAIVKKIIHLHNGTISCESIPLQGATFTVTIPIGM